MTTTERATGTDPRGGAQIRHRAGGATAGQTGSGTEGQDAHSHDETSHGSAEHRLTGHGVHGHGAHSEAGRRDRADGRDTHDYGATGHSAHGDDAHGTGVDWPASGRGRGGPEDPARTRADAARIVAEVAGRLADPERAARGRWDGGLTLGDSYPATALLFAELGHGDPAHRRTAHRHLALAVAAMTDAPPIGLYQGPAAVAFAAACAAHRPADYAGVLGPLDERIAAWAPVALRPERDRLAAGRPGTAYRAYDVVAGATGIGRYLLARRSEALDGILRYLVDLSAPLDGLPGWWVDHPANPADPGPGHANLGLAHGIPGPLALLAAAWRDGHRVPGHADAMHRIVDWLLDWRDGDSWPGALTREQLTDRPDHLPGTRAAWCYGAPGVAVALGLAGDALDRPECRAAGAAAVRAALARSEHDQGIGDAGLCHGSGGLLHLTRLVLGDDPVTHVLARRTIDRFEPDSLFGYRASVPGADHRPDAPGFLEGAAGVALALHAYATGGPTASGWDAALLAR